MVLEKKTRGRQKIDMVRIQNRQNLQVTFSKRRAGLFKKASDLRTLTGSEVALMVFSPGKKAYIFGSPSVNAVTDRFESQTLESVDHSKVLVDANHKINVQHLNEEITILGEQLEAEKKRADILNQQRQIGQVCHWWESPINEFNLEQLEQFHLALLELQKIVKSELKKPVCENANKNPNLHAISPHGKSLFGMNVRENCPSVFDLFQSEPLDPSWLDTDNSIQDRTVVSAVENGRSTLVACNPSASEFGGATMSHGLRREFNNGYGGVKWF